MSITKNDLKKIYKNRVCFYCGEIPKICSIDRVDNNKGYTQENCVLACMTCNDLKRKLTIKNFDTLKKIYNKIIEHQNMGQNKGILA